MEDPDHIEAPAVELLHRLHNLFPLHAVQADLAACLGQEVLGLLFIRLAHLFLGIRLQSLLNILQARVFGVDPQVREHAVYAEQEVLGIPCLRDEVRYPCGVRLCTLEVVNEGRAGLHQLQGSFAEPGLGVLDLLVPQYGNHEGLSLHLFRKVYEGVVSSYPVGLEG